MEKDFLSYVSLLFQVEYASIRCINLSQIRRETSNISLYYKNLKDLVLLFLQWVPEIKHHCQKTPFLIVGTKSDLRDDASTLDELAKNKKKPINSDEAERLARELGAVKYVECSARTHVSVYIAGEGVTPYIWHSTDVRPD